MPFAPDFDEFTQDDVAADPADFSSLLAADDALLGFAMIALRRGYEMVERGEDRGSVASAIELLFHETQGEAADACNVFDWASDYFENVSPEDFSNQFVSSPALGLYSGEEQEEIASGLEGALEQVQQELPA